VEHAAKTSGTFIGLPSHEEIENVVVLGMGNSAMDIAVEASFTATHTYLAACRGALRAEGSQGSSLRRWCVSPSHPARR